MKLPEDDEKREKEIVEKALAQVSALELCLLPSLQCCLCLL
jgi:hypothetical protein